MRRGVEWNAGYGEDGRSRVASSSLVRKAKQVSKSLDSSKLQEFSKAIARRIAGGSNGKLIVPDQDPIRMISVLPVSRGQCVGATTWKRYSARNQQSNRDRRIAAWDPL
jgi:hypothetical protein